jgi:hypothetical protein
VRREEWKLDVPTTGGIYQLATRVVYYLSGLGRSFCVGDLRSSRHWVNRAWTLQETLDDQQGIIACITSLSPSLPERLEQSPAIANAQDEAKELWNILIIPSSGNTGCAIGLYVTLLTAVFHRSRKYRCSNF